MNDPHEQRRVTRDHYYRKTEIRGRMVAVLDWTVEDRGLALIPHLSRAIRRGDILELVTTDEEDARPGAAVNRVAYLGFMEVNEGGLVLVGDTVTIEKNEVGEVVGFDETHVPNHLNVVIRVPARKTGRDAGFGPDGLVAFSGIEEDAGKQMGF